MIPINWVNNEVQFTQIHSYSHNVNRLIIIGIFLPPDDIQSAEDRFPMIALPILKIVAPSSMATW